MWDVTPYSLVQVHRCCLPFACCWIHVWLIPQPWRWTQYVPPKYWGTCQTALCHILEDSTLEVLNCTSRGCHRPSDVGVELTVFKMIWIHM
jgi:hypothetical protein